MAEPGKERIAAEGRRQIILYTLISVVGFAPFFVAGSAIGLLGWFGLPALVGLVMGWRRILTTLIWHLVFGASLLVVVLQVVLFQFERTVVNEALVWIGITIVGLGAPAFSRWRALKI